MFSTLYKYKCCPFNPYYYYYKCYKNSASQLAWKLPQNYLDPIHNFSTYFCVAKVLGLGGCRSLLVDLCILKLLKLSIALMFDVPIFSACPSVTFSTQTSQGANLLSWQFNRLVYVGQFPQDRSFVHIERFFFKFLLFAAKLSLFS